MRRAGGWIAALVLGAALVAGLIAVLQSRDESVVNPPATAAAPGERSEAAQNGERGRLVRQGNVLVLYSGSEAPGLGEDSPELREAGQAVVEQREPDLPEPYIAYSVTHRQAAQRPDELREFVDYWLGGR